MAAHITVSAPPGKRGSRRPPARPPDDGAAESGGSFDPPPKSQSHAALLDFLKARTTGLTLALAVALALGLSLAPIPEAWRPLPSLQRAPLKQQLVALVVPASFTGKRATRLPDDAATAGTGTTTTAPPQGEDEEPDSGTAVAELPPDLPVVPSTPGIGLEELSASTLARAMELEALRERMSAQHVDIELNCRKARADGACEEDGLAPFHRALSELRADTRRTPVRVVHLGDSLVASDYITDVVRDRLQERFGSGGKGFLFITRPASAGRWTRSGRGSDGWEIARLVDTKWPRDRVGWTGVAFTSGGGSQSTRYDVEGSRVAELFFLAQPASGAVQLSVDGRPLQKIQTRGFSKTKSEAAFARVNLPDGAKTLTLSTSGKVELHGVTLETGTPGVIYDTVGLLGGMAEVYLRAQPAAFRAQLRQRKPSMVVLMVGGNEAFFYSRERTTLDDVRAQMKELVSRVRANVPDAACLVMSPIDAGVRTMGGELVPRRGSKEVSDIFREEARLGGCAFWDAYTAMGGEGAALRWLEAGLMLEDLVHPRAKGSDLLGHLFDLALQRSFAKSRAPLVPVADTPGLRDADTALTKTFARLRRREEGESLRVGISQFGASHTAAHSFTDAVREVLARRFGDAGRGFIAAGKASPRLEGAKVARQLEGDWKVEDALEAPPGGLWGLTGIRAVGAPGASLRIEFCKGCAEAKEPAGRLDLYAMDVPEVASPEIRVDGEALPPDAPPPEPLTTPTVRIRSFPVTGPAHSVEVVAPQGGGATVLGAALEYDTPGVVLDALGLPGATAFTLRDMDAATVDAQLASRRPDLLVFWYGTNEAGKADLDAATLRHDYAALITRLRKATNAECLLLGPTDRLEKDASGRWTEAPALASVLDTLPRVAKDAGCAYWSARAAMGGERAMLRWQHAQPVLGNPDGVHLTPEGYARLAGAFARDLLTAYEARKKGEPTARMEGN
ncbi:GDSL-type esterase/lipase family protein [Myxococcus sp. K15C18031901]|uniref:GDSL-type esterase/lipase family protein n=1 Tax=Myxococcus dinghuensis TaxID=2906761 RepID=UPI0020A6EF12|nr:GDSL-type esterase/lipase family protein [Myxococcus dinghuensis]MCP3102223.1 GDSL-type esterase/lipase family protein [Myxococcus dinghuensis]